MKKILNILVLLFLLSFGAQAQTTQSAAQQKPQLPTTLDGWAARLQKFGKTIPQEQIFIHLDNTCYFLGDTIYFKAYVRRSDTGKPSNLSGLMYAELLNQDGYLVERQQIELKNGQGYGSFCLLDTLYGGYYELRAYTRWQLNWGAQMHEHTQIADRWFFNQGMAKQYFRDYDKLYSRTFPVYDKPTTPGEYQHDMTLRPLRRHFKAEGTPPDAVMQFYPEGGHLIAGLPNRVAFEANDEDGKHLEGSVAILDGAGKKVAEAKTEVRGRGSVEFTPQAGTTYTAQLTWKNGTAKQDLPQVEKDGCALKVSQADGKITVNLAAAGKAAQEGLGLTVMSQGLAQDFKDLGTGAAQQVVLDGKTLRTGVVQLTVFNAQGRIYADRLVFNRHGSDTPAAKLDCSGLENTAIEPYAPVSVDVKGGLANQTISLSVRDAAHTEFTYDDGSILTEMLLSSQIRGFVEQPGYYFESEDEAHNRALDLLLMIQGWRRYNWHTMATPGAFTLNYMPEQTQMMYGEVNTYRAEQVQTAAEKLNQAAVEAFNAAGDDSAEALAHENDKSEAATSNQVRNAIKNGEAGDDLTLDATSNSQSAADLQDLFGLGRGNIKKEVLMHAEFTKPGAPEGVLGDVMTKKGMFSIESPKFYEKCYFFVSACDTTKWGEGETSLTHNWVMNGEDEKGEVVYPDFYVKLNPIYPRFVKPYTWYQTHLAEAPKGSGLAADWLNDGSRTLDEVTVGARHNGMSRFDASKPAFVIDAYDAFNDVCDAGLCPAYFMTGSRFATDLAHNYIGDMNMERQYNIEVRRDTRNESVNMSDQERDAYDHLSNLYKVYIYTDYSPRREGDKHFEASNQPEIIVDLRRVPDQGKRDQFRDRRYVLQGYAVCEDFYQPNYSTKPLPEHKDYRRTLYWNPNLTLDAQGTAHVEFYNNGKQSQLSVEGEGMGDTGELMTTK